MHELYTIQSRFLMDLFENFILMIQEAFTSFRIAEPYNWLSLGASLHEDTEDEPYNWLSFLILETSVILF